MSVHSADLNHQRGVAVVFLRVQVVVVVVTVLLLERLVVVRLDKIAVVVMIVANQAGAVAGINVVQTICPIVVVGNVAEEILEVVVGMCVVQQTNVA